MSIIQIKEELIKDIIDIRVAVNELNSNESEKIDKITESLNDLQDKIFIL